jgi:site-specific DNA-methyltransferase (adenine-specific)
MNYQILTGDNRDTLKTLEDNSIDSIVTDPPYGIDFLGRAWDANTGALETYQECLRVLKPGGYILAFSAARTYHHLAVTLESAGFEIRDQIMWIYSSGFPKAQQIKDHPGWKTALKPAHEPIAVARKPITGTVENNMNQWGVGALNIDASRIEYENEYDAKHQADISKGQQNATNGTNFFGSGKSVSDDKGQGRFPSNVIGEIEGYQKYFYCPKVSKRERMTFNNHPTVKPVELMRYLIQLVTPDNSTVLDPFSGSGSTGMAAVELGHTFIGCELNPDYVEIAETRIREWNKPNSTFGDIFDYV